MEKEGSSRYIFFGLLAVVAIASFITVIPFIGSVIIGAILAFIFHPLFEWVHRKVKYRALSAFLIAFVLLLLVTIPSAIFIKNLAGESQYLYLRTKQLVFSGSLIEDRCYEDTFLCRSVKNINSLLRDEKTRTYLLQLMNAGISSFTSQLSAILFSLPHLVLRFMVTLFTTYYLLVDGPQLMKRLATTIPLKVHHQDQVIKQFGDVTYALIYGTLIVALIQGAIAAFGFWLFGVKGFLWWGVVTTFFALVPFVGTALIWVPISAFLVLSGYVGGEQSIMLSGLGLFLYGVFVISAVDNIIKPYIIAEHARVHPLLVMVGVLGGLYMFGPIGAIIGPFLLALLQTLFEIYERERLPHIGETEPCILGRNNKRHRH